MNASLPHSTPVKASRVKLANRVYISQPGGNQAVTQVALVLLENFSLMAFSAAVDALVTANLVNGAPLYRVVTYSLEPKLVRSDVGIELAADHPLAELGIADTHVLLVCGGYRTSLQLDRLLRKKLQQAAQLKLQLGGLWNGSYYLAQAGVLEGRKVTLHPDNRESYRERFPDSALVRAPYVLDAGVMSCAGSNSALPMMLHFIRAQQGEDCVQAIEEVLDRDRLEPEQDIYIASVLNRPGLPTKLKNVLEIMENNIEDPVSLDELVEYVGMSRRYLERLFVKHLNTSPRRFYLELRLTKARQLIMQSDEPMAAIAVACGFSCMSHFRHAYKTYFGLPPGRARRDRSRLYG
ncbi:GlxA family transcriptional regulator [Balneatrix alpica]|uniref:GlxA family transcriptional regulator n=1 Tax=Balneatrix alpica TaxID=75684 RepID=A0ABV5ZBQ4_9GAMM|nr:GlxA family transcriptional regulator [Balneatrix alpica]